MDFKNEVILRGIITEIRPLPRGNRTLYNLKVKTQRAYYDRNGTAQIKDEIHPCAAWPGRNNNPEKLRSLRVGDIVYIKGILAEEPVTHVFVNNITISKERIKDIKTGVKIN